MKFKCSSCQKHFARSFVLIKSRRKETVYYMCRPCNTRRCKKYRKENPLPQRKAVKKSTYKHYEKHKARMKVRWALKTGVLVKKLCKCGNKKVEAHHPDYSHPLKVKWMCRSCHATLHRKLSTVHT